MVEKIKQMLVKLAEDYCEATSSTFIWGEEDAPECLFGQQKSLEKEN